jgi:hypothetical protein
LLLLLSRLLKGELFVLSDGNNDGVDCLFFNLQEDLGLAAGEFVPLWVLGPVGLGFDDGLDSVLLSDGEFLGLSLLLGLNPVEFLVLLGQGLGERLLNDGGVWDGLVRVELDLSLGLSVVFQVGWGESELISSLLGLLGKNSDWEFDGDVLLESNLVFLHGVWNLKGQSGGQLSGETGINNYIGIWHIDQ